MELSLTHVSNYNQNFTKELSWKESVRSCQVLTDSSSNGIPRLDFLRHFRVSAVNLKSNEETFGGLFAEEKKQKVSVNPVYTPTPPNRELRTPHSGYHFDGSSRKFFEGWYFKVVIPEKRQSFCFMYSVENPAFQKKLSTLEQVTNGPRFTGVGAQILGADDKYICQFSEESQHFWGSRHELILGNTFTAGKKSPPPNREVPPQEFRDRVSEGFQVSPFWNQGFIQDDGRTTYAETVKSARWEYSTRPVYGWGDVGSKQKATAGWLAAFPVFEPHWQVCMAGGLSSGWIEWDGELFEFENAPSYSEKNWGGAFPRKWFWVQCNNFDGADGEIALTAAGGLRELPGLNTFENAALIGVHYDGIFYEFVPWKGTVSWEIAPWGYWHISADNQRHTVELETTTKDPGTTLRAPTLEAGLAPACKDTCFGDLRLRIWERRYDGSKGKNILDVTSNMAVVEVGGGPWFNTWKGRRFHFGRIEHKRAIITMTGKGMMNAAITALMMCNFFNLSAVLHYGLAGSADKNLNLGDIVIPQFWAHTGLWYWQKYGQGPNDALSSEEDGDFTRDYGYLNFADYTSSNDDTHNNFLNNVWFQAEDVFHFDGAPESRDKAFWIPITQSFFEQAKKLEGTALEDCTNTDSCLPRTPKVVTASRGSSASIYIDNIAYKTFLHSKFQVSLVDMESAAIALITHQQNIPFIAFRAINGPAEESSSKSMDTHIFFSLFIENCLKVLTSFVKIMKEPYVKNLSDLRNISASSLRSPL